MKGVTQAVYDAYRDRRKRSHRHVKMIESAEVYEIYSAEYWDRIKGNGLPALIAIAAFDFAVNSGVSKAAKKLQICVNVIADGIIGPATLRAVAARDERELLVDYLDAREVFFRRLADQPGQHVFLKGWLNRLNDLREYLGVMWL